MTSISRKTSFVLAASLAVLAACGGGDGGGEGGGGGEPIVPLLSGSGGASFTWSNATTATGGLLGGAYTFDSSGRLTGFADGVGGWALTDGTVADFGADGIVAWGRWSAGTSTHPSVGGSVVLAHYAGSTTAHAIPAGALASLSRSYTAARSPSPAVVSGTSVQAGSPDTITGSLTLDHAANSFTYSLVVPLGSATHQLSGAGTWVNGSAADARFLGGGTVTGGGCSGACDGWIPYGPMVQGLVFGATGERAVLGFGFETAAGKVSGVVVFR
jgi:hypothetical protein